MPIVSATGGESRSGSPATSNSSRGRGRVTINQMTGEQTSTPWWRRIDPWVPGWLLATLVVWGGRGFQDDLSRDSALYVYAGQQIAAGEAPYVEVLNRAGPLVQLLPGLGIELGRLLGTGDIVGIRILFLLLMVGAPALAHVLARDVFGSRLAGLAAGATLLAFTGLALSATDGPQSKQPMMVALLVGLLLLSRHRWLTAGVGTGLATLTWQPVLFVLVAAAVVTALLTPGDVRSRAVDLGRFVMGGLLTVAASIGYALATGSLDAFVEGFLGINASYTDQEGIAAHPLLSWTQLADWLGWTTWLLAAGSVLSLALGALALRRRPPSAHPVALAAATVAGLGWSALAFNGAPDSVLVLPLAATGIGGAVALVAARDRDRSRQVVTAIVAAWVAVALATTAQATWGSREPELPAAISEAEATFAALPDDATVFAFNAPQPLALAGRSSISRYVLFGEGMKQYVASRNVGGIRGFVSDVDEREPTLVVTSPRGLTGIMRPLARHYTEVAGGAGWRAFRREEQQATR